MKNILFILGFLCTALIGNAQKNITLKINHKLGSNSFAFNQTAQNDLNQQFQITRIDYYISKITLIHDGGMTTAVPDRYILAKGSNTVSELLGNFNITNIEGIRFSIGVDSPANNADPSLQPALSPLSFQSPSMHWGWSAGYRFVALEGKTGTGFSTVFELHGLWNANYFEQTVMVAGVNSGNNINIYLDADYTQALKGVNVSTGPLEHGHNGADLTVLQNFRDHVFTAGSPTALYDMTLDKGVTVYPNPSKGQFRINYTQANIKAGSYQLMDLNGRVIESNKLSHQDQITLSGKYSGTYFLVLFQEAQPVWGKKVVLE
ncbi:MbnP family protein [Edaphocola aurantiacus]|uniref:MbnP family protein n=1 Tax=Edaphocola aurantiacus TaxID=2601682 RepID=UPI001C96AE1D|nr:MbnP family protein [Edaphocola aurantiacus]